MFRMKCAADEQVEIERADMERTEIGRDFPEHFEPQHKEDEEHVPESPSDLEPEDLGCTVQTIVLDCPPGHPRPGDIIGYVIKGTGLPLRETSCRIFGNWEWDYNDIPRDMWKAIQPVLKERITKLYNDGIIRYGSW